MKKKLLFQRFIKAFYTAFLMAYMSFSALSQQMISGRVVDEKNDALIGVSILVKGTQKGTSTDVNGNYI